MVFVVPMSVTLRSHTRRATEARAILTMFHFRRNFMNCRSALRIVAMTATLLCLLPAPAALAATASDSFEDGNRLFRDDLYWAALLRYEQARQAGMNTPLLHYNTGVAHYRARQHIRARASLTKALTSTSLRALAHYNLGLNEYAAGNVDAALDWFRLARDQDENPRITGLARTAIGRVHALKKTADPYLVRAGAKSEKRAIAELDLHAEIGFGSDDNIFRTPGQLYIDFADPTLPLVTPAVQSGAYVPVRMRARYSVNSFEHESFFGAYRFSGRIYQDKELRNADEFTHEFKFGSEYSRREGARKREVFSAFSVAQHDETYFDPDDGAARASNGVLIDSRLNYLRYGPEMSFRQSHERLSIGAHVKGQLWNYDATAGTAPEYDHEYFIVGLNTQYKFTRTSLLRITVDRYSRRYGDRPSHDLDGRQRPGNPSVRYDYIDIGIAARQRIYSQMWFGVNYERTERTDRHEGYNDYVRDSYGLKLSWTPGPRFSLKMSGNYRIYNFPSAFAFHNPVAGPKTLETAQGRLTASYEITRHLNLVAEASYRGAASTDTRIGYDRNQYTLGVRWQQ